MRLHPFWTLAGCALAGFVLGAGTVAGSSAARSRAHHIFARIARDKPQDNAIWTEKAPLLATTPVDAKITFLGDSLTDFGDWDQLLPGADIAAHGIPGETTEGLLDRLRGGEKTGNAVFIEIGVNDVAAGLSVPESEANILAILNELRGKRIYLESPIYTKIDAVNDRVSAISSYEQGLCRSKRCEFIDLNATLAKGGRPLDSFLVDDVHLSWSAYKAWAAAVRPFVDGAPA